MLKITRKVEYALIALRHFQNQEKEKWENNLSRDDQDKFSIDESTGSLSFKTAPDYEIPLDSDKNKTYLIYCYLVE